jgi:glycosyltransferase involved in cell wall biosynthesis
MAQPKLLLINKFYHDVGPAGGVGRYLVQEEEDLTAAGWGVIPFAMADEHARPSRYDRFFVQARDYSTPRLGLSAMGDALSLIWNREAARNLDALIRETRPDVAHLHNIYHHLSPSILPVLARHGIPVVMTLHDLRLLCPAIHMLRDDEVCERCKGGQLHNAVLGKCVKESRAASLLAAVETFHQRTRRLYVDGVSVFLCPSDFYRRKYAEWGFPESKLVHLPNFVDLEFWHPDHIPADRDKDAYIYFGRISREKGLRDLLDAQFLWEQGHRKGELEKPLQLLIAGSGPCEGNMRARIAQLELQTVEVLGALDIDGLRQALGRARFSVLPSRWYENGPMAALESLASGIPLVGTEMGGIPEMIEEGVTGTVAPARNPDGLLKAIRETGQQFKGFGPAARRWSEEKASRRNHMETLQKILQRTACLDG